MANKSDISDFSVGVAEEAANYTLALSVSHVQEDFYDDEKEGYMRLTIRFPSPDFATGMRKRMQDKAHHSEQSLNLDEDPATANKRRKQEQAIFHGKSLTLGKRDKHKVSIVLPLSVKRVEADSKGIIVSFDPKKKDEAERWSGYSDIWHPRAEKYELRIHYNWSHYDLAKVVDSPKKNDAPKKDNKQKKEDKPKKNEKPKKDDTPKKK